VLSCFLYVSVYENPLCLSSIVVVPYQGESAMATNQWNFRSVRIAAFVSICVGGAASPALAVPPTPNTSGLTPEQCYRKDSDCTQFCGDVADSDYRYECFGICDRMLDRCLDTGDWTDSKIEPGTGRPTVKGQLSGRLLRMLMILGDADGDGAISPKEMQSIRDKVFKGHGAEVDQKSPPSNK
jgi:hypothetical protein